MCCATIVSSASLARWDSCHRSIHFPRLKAARHVHRNSWPVILLKVRRMAFVLPLPAKALCKSKHDSKAYPAALKAKNKASESNYQTSLGLCVLVLSESTQSYTWIFLSPIFLPFRGKLLVQGKSSYFCLEAIFLSFVFWMYATNWRRRFSPKQKRFLAIQRRFLPNPVLGRCPKGAFWRKRRFLIETTKIYVVAAKSGNSPLRVF